MDAGRLELLLGRLGLELAAGVLAVTEQEDRAVPHRAQSVDRHAKTVVERGVAARRQAVNGGLDRAVVVRRGEIELRLVSKGDDTDLDLLWDALEKLLHRRADRGHPGSPHRSTAVDEEDRRAVYRGRRLCGRGKVLPVDSQDQGLRVDDRRRVVDGLHGENTIHRALGVLGQRTEGGLAVGVRDVRAERAQDQGDEGGENQTDAVPRHPSPRRNMLEGKSMPWSCRASVNLGRRPVLTNPPRNLPVSSRPAA